jgi:repressor LexA
MARPLTPRQQAVLAFLRAETARRGFPPTLREVGEHFGFRSTASARDHLRALERKGCLTRQPHLSRGIVLAAPPPPVAHSTTKKSKMPPRGIPLLGEIAAGAPKLAIEQHDEALPIDPALFGGGELFALRVQGDSMVEAGILNGDFALVRPQADVPNGAIVAALIDDAATVKRFFRHGRRVRLQPENPTMEPLLLDARDAELRILGLVVGVIRKL